jgi:hypothetical protein
MFASPPNPSAAQRPGLVAPCPPLLLPGELLAAPIPQPGPSLALLCLALLAADISKAAKPTYMAGPHRLD